MKVLILFAMIFAHIVDDYYLQGILANMKQRKWWQENVPDKLYEHDYVAALIAHSFSWSFMTALPTLLISTNYLWICLCIATNAFFHAVIDDLKANKHRINLIQDQLVHLVQIICLWLVIIL